MPDASHCPNGPGSPARRRVLAYGAAALAGTPAFDAARAGRQSQLAFALIGDIPYSDGEAASLAGLLENWPEDLDFAIHVGDLKSGSSSCADAALDARVRLLDRSTKPLVYVPGDNEWTDCGRLLAGRFDPLERLAWLRRRIFSSPRPLGRGALALSSQSAASDAHGLPENQRWSAAGIPFVTLNLPGSRNAAAANVPLAFQRQRLEANARWLGEAFRHAMTSKAPAIVIAVHANPEFHRGVDRLPGQPDPRPANPPNRGDPYLGFRRQLFDLTAAFDGDVLVLHGDTHRFQDDRPWRFLPGWLERNGRALPAKAAARIRKLRRIECYGSWLVGAWVRIDYEPGSADRFHVRSEPIEPPPAQNS